MEVLMKRLVLAAAAGCALAGCSSNDTATEADYDDVAQSLSAVVSPGGGGNQGGDVSAMQDSATVSLGTAGLSLSANASGKYTGHRAALDYEYTATCSDAAGAEQKCGSKTDSSTVKVDWSGELALTHLTAAVTRAGTWRLSDIQSGVATIEGDSNFSLDLELQSLFRTAQRSYHIEYDANYAAIKLDLTAQRIESGTVSYTIDAERTVSGTRRDSEAKFKMDGELTFDRDGGVTLTLDGDYKYAIDTTTGVVIKTR
jgi:hypothetical protein